MLANGYSARLLDLRVVYFILWKEYLGSQAFIFAMWKLMIKKKRACFSGSIEIGNYLTQIVDISRPTGWPKLYRTNNSTGAVCGSSKVHSCECCKVRPSPSYKA